VLPKGGHLRPRLWSDSWAALFREGGAGRGGDLGGRLKKRGKEQKPSFSSVKCIMRLVSQGVSRKREGGNWT